MNKLRVTMLVMAAILLLSGCTAAKTTTGMEIMLTELTESEQELLDFVGVRDTISMFSYTIDDTIQSVSIEILTLNDAGEWEGWGGVTSAIDTTEGKSKTGRFMILQQEDGKIKLSEQHEGGTTSWSSEAVYDSLVGDGAKIGNRLADSVEIVLEQPIPVIMFGRSTKNTVRSYALSEYQNTAQLSDYDAVSVITVCFSRNKLE